LKKPTVDTLKALLAEGAKQRALHQRYSKAKELKSAARKRSEAHLSHWEKRANSHLFRSKRAIALADLLSARIVLTRYFGTRPTKTQLAAMMNDSEGLHVV